MKPPTQRQKEVLDFVRRFQRDHGFPPTRPGDRQGIGRTQHLDRQLVPRGPRKTKNPRNHAQHPAGNSPPGRRPPGRAPWEDRRSPIRAGRESNRRLGPDGGRLAVRPAPPRISCVWTMTWQTGSASTKAIASRSESCESPVTPTATTGTPDRVDGHVVLARVGRGADGELLLRRYHRLADGQVMLSPESRNKRHQPITVRSADAGLEGVMVGAIIGAHAA